MKPRQRENLVYAGVLDRTLVIDEQGQIFRGDRRAENDTGQYLQIRLMRNKYRAHALAHRLVWRHYYGEIPPGITINHKDGNKKNNRPSNLELATYSEQVRHARSVLGKMGQQGIKNNHAKLCEAAIREIRRRRAAGQTLKSIAQEFGVSDRTISKIARGESWAFIG